MKFFKISKNDYVKTDEIEWAYKCIKDDYSNPLYSSRSMMSIHPYYISIGDEIYDSLSEDLGFFETESEIDGMCVRFTICSYYDVMLKININKVNRFYEYYNPCEKRKFLIVSMQSGKAFEVNEYLFSILKRGLE